MHTLRRLTLLFSVLLLVPTATARDLTKQEKEEITKQLHALAYAVEHDDVDMPLRLMPDVIIEASGGYDHLKEVLIAAYRQEHASGIKIESCQFDDNFNVCPGENHEYLIVHERIVLAFQDKHGESLTYLLGVRSKDGGPWKFVDGGNLTREIVKKFFPDFPDIELPEIKRRILDEKS
jgi:hypothetical protein